ncbi:hypothetical protein JTE90_010679 [Oedothorax gibbosus]|uniref:Uncharacterized protein n=1 Tax=Oedothorax gibbosus TaxID=931172 RepID=A0AAV6UT63_9ARAC|nr:hypothetical protein JTE90_010679 [Oedothorax gibbosus]
MAPDLSPVIDSATKCSPRFYFMKTPFPYFMPNCLANRIPRHKFAKSPQLHSDSITFLPAERDIFIEDFMPRGFAGK